MFVSHWKSHIFDTGADIEPVIHCKDMRMQTRGVKALHHTHTHSHTHPEPHGISFPLL